MGFKFVIYFLNELNNTAVFFVCTMRKVEPKYINAFVNEGNNSFFGV